MESLIKLTSITKETKRLCSVLLAKAFCEYPLYVYGIKETKYREKKLQVLFDTLVEFTARYGTIYAIGEPFKAVMLVLPSKSIPISNWNMFLSGATHIFFKVGLGYLLRQQIITRKQEEFHQKYMPDAHRYIFTIGVDPACQGQKLASRLIRGLQEEGLPIYLETNKEINAQIYQKLGFNILDKFTFPKIDLTLWGMRWDPK